MLQRLRSHDRDFYRRLMSITLPVAGQYLITFSLGLIDTFMVSQLGNDAMAAVTAANVPVFLLLSIVFGFQSGLGILVSQYWGKEDRVNICRALGVACFLGLGLCAILALAMFLFPVQIMDLLSNRHELSLLGAPYLKLIGFSYACNMLSSLYVSVRRSIGKPRFGMRLFSMSTVLNAILNYAFIFGRLGAPALGVRGAALATLLARGAEVTVCAVCAVRDKAVPIRPAAFLKPGWSMAKRFLRYSSPVIVNELLWGIGTSVLTVILGYMDNSVEMLAGYSVTGNLGKLVMVICFGTSAATAVMVGNAIGQGKSRDEVMDLSLTLLSFTTLVGAGLATFFLLLIPVLFRPVIFPLFRLHGESAVIATALAVTGFAGTPFHAYASAAVTGALRAGGDVRWSILLDVGPQWLLAVPLTALAALVLGGNCWIVGLAIQSENILKVPVCMLRVHSRKWINDVTKERA